MSARASIVGDRLQVHRTGVARWVGASVDVPLAHVVSVDAADAHDLKHCNKGIRIMGIQVPGLMIAGIFRNDGEQTWWDIRRGLQGIVITLRGERLARVVVEVDDPATIQNALSHALDDARDQSEMAER